MLQNLFFHRHLINFLVFTRGTYAIAVAFSVYNLSQLSTHTSEIWRKLYEHYCLVFVACFRGLPGIFQTFICPRGKFNHPETSTGNYHRIQKVGNKWVYRYIFRRRDLRGVVYFSKQNMYFAYIYKQQLLSNWKVLKNAQGNDWSN